MNICIESKALTVQEEYRDGKPNPAPIVAQSHRWARSRQGFAAYLLAINVAHARLAMFSKLEEELFAELFHPQ